MVMTPQNNNIFHRLASGQPSNKESPKKGNPFYKLAEENQAKFEQEGENDLERDIERNVARGTSRILETVGGLPGDLYSFAKGLFTGDSETNLPTSQSLKKFSEEASLGYTKPQNELEEKGDEVLQDIASFMIPGAGKYNMVRNIGIPIVANLAKEGVKSIGGEKSADAAKIGTMIVLDLMNLKGGGAKKFASDLFNESEKLIPKGAKVISPKLESSIENLKKTMESGGSRPSTEKALKKINEIQEKFPRTQVKGKKVTIPEIEVQELIDYRKAINEIKTEIGGYEVQIPKPIKKKISANLDLVKKEVIEGLNEYGTHQNPEFLKLNKAANEAYGAYEASDKMGKFIRDKLKGAISSPVIKTILGLRGTIGAAAKTVGVATPLYLGYESYKILHQVIQSPTLRKFYGNILKGAAAGNASQVIKNSKALEKELEKESNI